MVTHPDSNTLHCNDLVNLRQRTPDESQMAARPLHLVRISKNAVDYARMPVPFLVWTQGIGGTVGHTLYWSRGDVRDACDEQVGLGKSYHRDRMGRIFRVVDAVRCTSLGHRLRQFPYGRNVDEPVSFQALHDAGEPGQVRL